MSRKLAIVLTMVALAACAAVASASVPDPANSSVVWGGPFNGSCTFPVICPRGTGTDPVATVNVTVKDQFNTPMVGIAANEVEAAGSCFLLGGSPCGQVISVQATAPTDALGSTTIQISKAGGCCTDLQIRARGITLNTLSYRSYDFTADGSVNLADLGFLANTFNKKDPAGGEPPSCLTFSTVGYNGCFDFNCDNCVNLSDLGLFASHFNHVCV
jgi:hypothetical protein